eukprot:jgi/Chrzof1/2044/UNPLg00700.t1
MAYSLPSNKRPSDTGVPYQKAEQTLKAAATYATNLTRSKEKQELYHFASGRPGKAPAEGLKAEVSQLTVAEQTEEVCQAGGMGSTSQ